MIGDQPDPYSVYPFGDQPAPPTAAHLTTFGPSAPAGGAAAGQRGLQDFSSRRRQLLLGGEQLVSSDTRGAEPRYQLTSVPDPFNRSQSVSRNSATPDTVVSGSSPEFLLDLPQEKFVGIRIDHRDPPEITRTASPILPLIAPIPLRASEVKARQEEKLREEAAARGHGWEEQQRDKRPT
ncbi:PREDICTED: uncharacterized protein LOC106817906 [Priapulus caudatus]|uniref:Uncharacterized protein LOC106817906 n=1 Tax=Priapulus caudatus TaxID=37621 RepID=A0ABM1F0Y1_PRICU|nr:PREDICTED: uncharacterized protein LOC106817906 [Priapulus caudatus]